MSVKFLKFYKVPDGLIKSLIDEQQKYNTEEILIAMCTFYEMFQDETPVKLYAKYYNEENTKEITAKIITKTLELISEPTLHRECKKKFADYIMPIVKDVEITRTLVRQLNDSIYDAADEEDEKYIARSGTIIMAMQKNCAKIVEMLKNNIDVGSMEARDIFPEYFEEINKSIELREKQVIQDKYSVIFMCPICKNRKVKYYEKFTRSLDEATTMMCTCLVCGHQFKR